MIGAPGTRSPAGARWGALVESLGPVVEEAERARPAARVPARPRTRVPACERCGELDVELYCQCCGRELCSPCWDDGDDDRCASCIGLGWDEGGAVAVEVPGGLL